MTPDIINGFFEFAGAFVLALDVRALYRDKRIKGVYWPTRIFFAAWGLWNLYYYPAIAQWWSFSGGAMLVMVNVVWCVLAAYYVWQEEKTWLEMGL